MINVTLSHKLDLYHHLEISDNGNKTVEDIITR